MLFCSPHQPHHTTTTTLPQTAPTRVEAFAGERIVAVSAAKFHSVALTDSGAVYTWGFGRSGRLGHGDSLIHSGVGAAILPRAVAGLGGVRVVAVAAGKHHTLAAADAGDVYSWGSNRDGRLGYTQVDTQPTPRKVTALSKQRVVAVACANKHSLAVTSAGDLFSWGCNARGQLGYGTCENAASAAPRPVDLRGKAVAVATAAKAHTLVLTADGEALTWGHKVVSPRRVAMGPAAAMLAGEIRGRPALKFHHRDAKLRLRDLAAGATYSLALTAEGAVLAWRSADPSLRAWPVRGLGAQRAVRISAAKRRCAVVTEAGDVYVWDAESSKGGSSQAAQREAALAAQASTPGGGGGGARGANLGSSPKGASSGALGAASGGGAGSFGRSGGGFLGGGGPPSFGGLSSSFAANATSTGGGGGGAGSFGAYSSSPQGRSSPCHSPGAQPGSSNAAGSAGGFAMAEAAARMAAAAASIEVVPVRVSGLKRIVAVAVGEKHTLALSTTVMFPRGSAAASAAGGTSAAVSAGRFGARSSSLDSPSAAAAAAADGGAASEEDSDAASDSEWDPLGMDDEDFDGGSFAGRHQGGRAAAGARGAQQEQQAPGGAAARGGGRSAAAAAAGRPLLPAPASWLPRPADAAGRLPSLKELAEETVAARVAEARNALQLIEVADALQAVRLKSFCQQLALCNLDLVLSTPQGERALSEIHPSLVEELEELIQDPQGRAAGGLLRRSPTARAEEAESGPQGERSVSSVSASSSSRPAGGIRGAMESLALLRRRAGAAEGEAGSEAAAAAQEAVARQLRATRKKLAQIDALQAKLAGAPPADAAVAGKLARRAGLAAAVAALEAGDFEAAARAEEEVRLRSQDA